MSTITGGKTPDCVAVMSASAPEVPIAVLGAFAAGCAVTLVRPMYTSRKEKREYTASNS